VGLQTTDAGLHLPFANEQTADAGLETANASLDLSFPSQQMTFADLETGHAAFSAGRTQFLTRKLLKNYGGGGNRRNVRSFSYNNLQPMLTKILTNKNRSKAYTIKRIHAK
jgi:hypothetical protein